MGQTGAVWECTAMRKHKTSLASYKPTFSIHCREVANYPHTPTVRMTATNLVCQLADKLTQFKGPKPQVVPIYQWDLTYL